MRKKFWIAPLIIVFLFVGVLIVLTQGSVVAPFIYPLFCREAARKGSETHEINTMLGMTYKPETADTRDSPPRAINYFRAGAPLYQLTISP